MEYLKTYYSLERHLEETVKFNPQFEILNAIWKLNKKNLSSALSNVTHYFPHYSLHDKSHSNTIINNIESFLGEDRIKKLSPTNTWLLLMASFTHDLGMVVFQEIIEKEWSSDAFQEFLLSICDWDDEAMRESGQILIMLQKLPHDNKDWDSSISPIKIKNAVTLVVAEYMRRIHNKRSSDILKGIDKTFNEVANAFYSDQIPNRLLNLLGDVAYLHGAEFYEILKRLDYESNGISSDKINPRFIASMLRLGDLLDIDDGRFNIYTTKVFNLPDSSTLHQKKHSSIKHFLITPQAIEITADCPEEQVYRLARNWFDWLEFEVENLNKEWSNIAPEDLTGSAPRIPKGKIKVYYNGSRANDDLLNLRFQVSNEKIFEILEGGSIYDKAEFTFIRELVQNALDASKIQLWTEIERGTYDFVFRMHFADTKLSHENIISKIKFPNDIPESLMDSFQIDLNIKWDDDKKENLLIEVIDAGTGISDFDLIRMTTKVGQSRKENKSYSEMLTRMPFWLKPTGAFGIGLQSLFIIVDSFNVSTKVDGEDGKIINFRSSKKGKYSTVKTDLNVSQRGTKVQVLINKSKFFDVFGGSFDWNIIANYDPFTDEYGNMHMHKIRQYAESVLYKIPNLNIDFFGKIINHQKSENNEINYLTDVAIKNDHAICNIFYRDNELYFEFYENIIGSQFVLKYFASDLIINDDFWPAYKAIFFVRDIPVESNLIYYNKLSYCKLFWNFMSQSSDKILSITREKFLSKEKTKFERKFQREVLPKVLPIIDNFFSDNNNIIKLKNAFSNNTQTLSYIYFKIILTLKVNEIGHASLNNEFLNIPLDKFILQKANDNQVSMAEFLDSQLFVIPISYGHSFNNTAKPKSEIIAMWQNMDPNYIIIWKSHFFSIYFLMNYYISEIQYYEHGHILIIKKGSSPTSYVKVTQGDNYYLDAFNKRVSLSERIWNYSNEKYAGNLSVLNEYNSGFEDFQYLSTTSVISPFSNIQQVDDLIKKFNWNAETSLKNIKNNLSVSVLKTYVTNNLIEWLITYKPDKSVERSEKDILNGYKDLITDIIVNKLKKTTTIKSKSKVPSKK